MLTQDTIDRYGLDERPPTRGLLTLSNPKTLKGEDAGYLTAILHLAPHTLSGRNVCAFEDSCAAPCLNTAGHGGIALDEMGLNPVQVARIRRTRFFSSDRRGFMAALVHEISLHVARAERHGLKPAVRLNGTSDLPWERIRCEGTPNVFSRFPGVQFYDYTKAPLRVRSRALEIPNYSLCYSLAVSERNHGYAREALSAGLNVAAVFSTRRGQPLPASFWGRPVIDGDLTDLRFLDPRGVIVGLRAKGNAISDTSGFVQAA
jgi:hypothetical protein